MRGASPLFNPKGGIPHRDHGPAPLSPSPARRCVASSYGVGLEDSSPTRPWTGPQDAPAGTPPGPALLPPLGALQRAARTPPAQPQGSLGTLGATRGPPAQERGRRVLAPVPRPKALGGANAPRGPGRGRGRGAPETAEAVVAMGAHPPQAEALGRGGAGCPRGSDCSIPSSVRRDLRRAEAPEGPSVGRTALPPNPFQGPEGGVLAV